MLIRSSIISALLVLAMSGPISAADRVCMPDRKGGLDCHDVTTNATPKPTLVGQRCTPDGRGGFICTYVPDNCSNPWQMGCN
jgi:hypothetical protein